MARYGRGDPPKGPQWLKVLKNLPNEEYHHITHLAALVCHTPISLISLKIENQHFFKSHQGSDVFGTSFEQSVCTHAIKNPRELFIVEDIRKDDRFKNFLETNDKPNIAFYAAMPLVESEGTVLGALCVMDNEPRKLEDQQLEGLKSLAHQLVQLFELHKERWKLKDTSDQLSLESERLNNIINATQAGTWEWHIPSGEVNINERWAEMLGYTVKELEPLNIEEVKGLIFQEDVQDVNEKVAACFEKRSDFYRGDYRFMHKKGHHVWIHDRGQVVRWTEDGQPLLMVGTHTDITERKNTEAQLKTISDNMPGAVFRYKLYVNGEDELQSVSNGAKALWGFTADKVMENNAIVWAGYENEDFEGLLLSIQKSKEELSFWEYEWRYHHPDGSIRWHKAFGNPVRLADGSTVWDSIILDITEEKVNKLEVENSEKRFKALVQDGADLIAILDFEANYLYVSPTSTNVLGIPPEEFIGKNAFEFIHPDDKELVEASLLRLEDQKQVTIKPFRFKHGNGSWRWVETIITNLINDPAVGGLVANSRDITERILTTKRLMKSEARYRGLNESQTSFVIRTDMEGNYTYVNKKFVEEYGWLYPNEKIKGKGSLLSIKPYHHQKVEDTVRHCCAEPGKVFKIEIDKPTKEGKIASTLWDFVCLLDPAGNPSEIQCVGLDITDRIQSEKALKESEQRYSDLFQLSPQPNLVYDISTLKILDVNEAAIEHYGYSYEEFLNMTLREIRPKSEVSKLEEKHRLSIEKETPYNVGEVLHQKKNGEEIIVQVRVSILPYKGKRAKVAVVNDITERYKHMQAIEAQNEKLKKISWQQSHEVRGPLAQIMGLIELLKSDYSTADEKEQFLEHLMSSAKDLDAVIRKIISSSHN